MLPLTYPRREILFYFNVSGQTVSWPTVIVEYSETGSNLTLNDGKTANVVYHEFEDYKKDEGRVMFLHGYVLWNKYNNGRQTDKSSWNITSMIFSTHTKFWRKTYAVSNIH